MHLGVGSHNTRDMSVSLRGGQGEVSYALGLSGESSDGFNAQPAGNPDRDGYRNRSVSGRLVWNPMGGQKLEATLLDNHQKSGYDGYMSSEDDQSQHDLRTLGLTWSAAWTDAWNTRVGVTRGTDRYETTPSPYVAETQIDTYLLRNEWRMGSATLTADLERREDQLVNDYTTPSKTDRSQDALALGYTLRHGAHTMQLNARRDDDSEFGGQSTGTAAYAYALSPTLRATASFGTAFRVPTLFQRFSYYGTPDLKAETSRNVEAGLHYQSGHDSAGFTFYRNDVKDLINYVAGPGNCANGTGDYAGCYGNTGRARYSGVTLTGGSRIGAVNLGGSLDVMQPKNRDTGLLLARRAKQQATLTADTLAAGWRLGGEVQYVGARYNDAANTQKLSGYGLLNLTASKAITADWQLQTRVDNLTDKAYESVLGYATAGRTFYVGLNWSPR